VTQRSLRITSGTLLSLTILMGKGGNVGLTDKLRAAQKKEGLVYPEKAPGDASAPKATTAPAAQPVPVTTPPAAPEKAAAPVPAQ
jgi:hypothetical protein